MKANRQAATPNSKLSDSPNVVRVRIPAWVQFGSHQGFKYNTFEFQIENNIDPWSLKNTKGQF